jgi:hypothetical protein
MNLRKHNTVKTEIGLLENGGKKNGQILIMNG